MINQLLAASAPPLEVVLSLLEERSSKIGILYLPKFKLEADEDLKSSLEAIGIERCFQATRAELTNMYIGAVYLKDIKQQAMIETTSEGLKAADKSRARKLNIFHADPIMEFVQGPFLFLLRYKSVPLFIGRLTNLPESSRNR